MDIDTFGGRKMVLAVVVVVAGLLAHALLSNGLSDTLVTLLLGVMGSFTVGNGIEHAMAARTAENSAASPEGNNADGNGGNAAEITSPPLSEPAAPAPSELAEVKMQNQVTHQGIIQLHETITNFYNRVFPPNKT